MTDPMKVTGGCHCGAVRFEAELKPGPAIICNCSHCAIKGLTLAFAPAEKFHLLSGEEQLTEYRFNMHVIAHRFCSRCGVQPFGAGQAPDGSETVAINMRCVDGADLEALETMPFDGRSL